MIKLTPIMVFLRYVKYKSYNAWEIISTFVLDLTTLTQISRNETFSRSQNLRYVWTLCTLGRKHF